MQSSQQSNNKDCVQQEFPIHQIEVVDVVLIWDQQKKKDSIQQLDASIIKDHFNLIIETPNLIQLLEILSMLKPSPSVQLNNISRTKVLVQSKLILLCGKFQELSYILKDLLLDGYSKKTHSVIPHPNSIKKDILSQEIKLNL